jgi:tRNA threonylcarbamoyladenosine biosynthesis protein TsaE
MHNPNGNSATAALKRHLKDEAATLRLGAKLAKALRPGLIIYLCGDLGSGKTTLARGLLRALGYTGRVKSPTFALVEVYSFSSLDLYHFDFYRLGEPREWADAGFRENFNDANVCLVEWPERAGASLPPADIRIRLSFASSGRDAEITGETEKARQCLSKLSL